MPEKRKVRRCLFGRPDQGVVQKELEQTLRDDLDSSLRKRKWNFDFDLDKPIDNGRYAWEEIPSDEYVPSFYRKGYTTKSKTFCELRKSDFLTQPAVPRPATQFEMDNLTSNGNCSPCLTALPDVRKPTEMCSSSSSITVTCPSNPVQSRITDHMRSRRRRRGAALEPYTTKSPRI